VAQCNSHVPIVGGIHPNGPMTRADRVATLEDAKARFQKSWDAGKALAKLEEVTLALPI
jgi:hypothetical protein